MTLARSLPIISTVLFITACSSTPDRREPAQDRQVRGPVQSSGVFVKPIGLLFTAMDSNGDTKTSKEELTAGIAAEWARLEGRSSAAYFMDWSNAALGSTDAFPTFMSFDHDLNGIVTELEFSDRLKQEFASMDKNKDGQVSRDEMLISFEAPRGRQAGGGEQGGRGEGRGGRGGGRGGDRPTR